jgi:hypothetical protein
VKLEFVGKNVNTVNVEKLVFGRVVNIQLELRKVTLLMMTSVIHNLLAAKPQREMGILFAGHPKIMTTDNVPSSSRCRR